MSPKIKPSNPINSSYFSGVRINRSNENRQSKFEPKMKIIRREGQGYFRTGYHVVVYDARVGRNEHAQLWCDGKAAGSEITRREDV